jgi:hypothetical protein
MGRLLEKGFEVKFDREDGVKTVVLPPGLCYATLWDPIDSVDGAKFQLLFDILGSDVDFYGRLFGTRHLAAYLSEPPRKEDSMPIRYVEFRWQADRSHFEGCHPDGDLLIYLVANGVGSHDHEAFQGDPVADVGYALDFVPLPSLVTFPVRICDVVECEEYGRGRTSNSKSVMGRMPVRLIDVLGALVEEASFHGSPEERDGRLEDLKGRSKQVEADIASGKINEYITLDDFRVKLGLEEKEGERPPGLETSEETRLVELTEKVAMYEGLLHDLQMYAEITLQEDKVRKLVANICRWSYAHRVGNGENTEEEQYLIVRKAFEKLREVP